MKKKKETNITQLNNYSYHKTLENIRHSKHRRLVRIRMGILMACGAALIAMAGWPLLNNVQKTKEINQLYVEASSEYEELENEKKKIEYQVSLLEDEEYIAKLARKELNLSKEDEILINLPEEVERTESNGSNIEEENESE